MESPDGAAEGVGEKSAENGSPGGRPDAGGVDMARLERMVTPEQELSASVAKKRRTFTKKRSVDKVRRREATPVRGVGPGDDDVDRATTTDEDAPPPPAQRPKTPERKRRKRPKVDKASKSEPEITDGEPLEVSLRKSNSIPRHFLHRTRENLTEIAQSEVSAFLSKTKKSIVAAAGRGRDRFKKVDKEQLKRSQSAPHSFTEAELIESFRKAQLLDVTPSSTRKNSDSSMISSVSHARPPTPKELRPEAREFVRQRKRQRAFSGNKIIEILDPTTKKVVSTKEMATLPDMKVKSLITTLSGFGFKELRTSYKAFKVDMKDECERIRLLRNRCMSQLFCILILCGIGGFMFKFVEGSFEYFYKCGVKRVKRDFVELLWVKSHNLREEDWKSLARTKLRVFEEELHAAHEAGVKTYSGQKSWSFLNAVVYSLSVITTIGYGHIYPDTKTGKALTIVYAIIGIPLFLLALTDFGKLFTRCIKFLWSFVRRVYYTGSCRRVRKTAHVKELFKGAQIVYEIATFRRPSIFTEAEDPENPGGVGTATTPAVGDDTPTTPAISNFEIDDEFNLPISLAIFILVLYIFLGALIYCIGEDWNFFDSFYFVFISMSTIGFGDLVPSHAVFMIISLVYLVFGLALMSMCINVVQEKLSDTFKQASSKIGATIGISVNEDDGSMKTTTPETVEVAKVHDGTTTATTPVSPNTLQVPMEVPNVPVQVNRSASRDRDIDQ